MDGDPGTRNGAERDEETGLFTAKYPREDYTRALEIHDGMAGTMDVAACIAFEHSLPEIDTTLESITYKNLRQLAEDDQIEKKKVGGSNVWILPNSSA